MKSEEDGRGEYVRKVRERTRKYLRDVLTENETLRDNVAKLQNERSFLEDRVKERQQELDSYKAQHERLRRQLDQIEAENRSFSEQFLDIEQQNANLANLYVASCRLHSTLDRQKVLGAIQEIIINLIGSEELGVFESSDDEPALALVSHFGIEPSRYARIPFGTGLIGRTAVIGEAYIASRHNGGERLPTETDLTACIPLKLDGRIIGTIAIFKLLEQKAGLEDLDIELFDLLATHAATALYCTRN